MLLLRMDVNAINKENAVIIRSCEKAAADLKRALGKGDPRGRKQVYVLYILIVMELWTNE